MTTKPAHYKPNGKGKQAPGARKKRSNQPRALAKEKMTPKRWDTYIAAVANGGTHREAAHEAGISTRTVDAHLISNVAAVKQLREAKLLWNRREWPLHKIEDVLARIAIGRTLKQAFDDCEIPRKHLGSLYRVLLKDKAIRKLYDEARELQAESFADEIIDISDETSNDWDDEGKANHELINRSRLRVDTRKWLAGKYVQKRFGDIKQVEHHGDLNINHAAVLSGGRRRLEQLQQKRSNATIDNDTGEVVVND